MNAYKLFGLVLLSVLLGSMLNAFSYFAPSVAAGRDAPSANTPAGLNVPSVGSKVLLPLLVLNAPAAGFWGLTGNTGTNPATDFLGTTDVQPLIFRVNNTEAMRLTSNGRLGIGVTDPAYALHVGADRGVRFELGTGYPLSLGGQGGFDVDAPLIPGGRFRITEAGNVGIGTTSPSTKLTVNGTVKSTSGGFAFPDGSVQTTAAQNTGAGITYTNYRFSDVEISPSGSAGVSVLHLDLPAGSYLIEARSEFQNLANLFGQNNTRLIWCEILDETLAQHAPGDGAYGQLNWHGVKYLTGAQAVDLTCKAASGGTDRSYVHFYERRLTAVKLAAVILQ